MDEKIVPPLPPSDLSRPLPHRSHRKKNVLVALNFKVTQDFHRTFKTRAVQHDMSMHEQLIQMYAVYVAHEASDEQAVIGEMTK